MPSPELDRAFALALQLSVWAADRIRGTAPSSTMAKRNAADVVTDVDVLVERHVRDAIGAAFPTHRVQGEELGGSGPETSDHVWYLDPVDGTSNYAAGLPWSSFSLSLADAKGALLAVVVDPWRDETFSARRSGGATRNGTPLHVRDATSLAGTLVLTELRGHEPWRGLFELMTGLGEAYATTRILGSSALSLVSTAAGRSAATVLGAFDPIDDLAGILIAREAGAAVTLRPGLTPAAVIAAPGVVDRLIALIEGRT